MSPSHVVTAVFVLSILGSTLSLPVSVQAQGKPSPESVAPPPSEAAGVPAGPHTTTAEAPSPSPGAVRIVGYTPTQGSTVNGTLQTVGVTVAVPANTTAYVGVYLGDRRVAGRVLQSAGRQSVQATINRSVETLTATVARAVIIEAPAANGSAPRVDAWSFSYERLLPRRRPPVEQLVLGEGRTHGLSKNQTAALFSGDGDGGLNQSVYRTGSGEDPTLYRQFAAATDITFDTPPSIARTWTQAEASRLRTELFRGSDGPADRTTSYYPSGASLQHSAFISEAHATLFGIYPSTKLHWGSRPVTYVAPRGAAYGLIDYRVWTPAKWQYTEQRRNGTFTRTFSYSVVDTSVYGELWFQIDTYWDYGERLSGNPGHVPVLPYQNLLRYSFLRDGVPLELRGQISVDVRVTRTTFRPLNESRNNSNRSVVWRDGEAYDRTITTTNLTDSVTPEDRTRVQGYQPNATVRYAEYPDGTNGVAIESEAPISRVVLNRSAKTVVDRGWEFYTVRDRSWDTLVTSTAGGSSTAPTPAIPMYVHGYLAEDSPTVQSKAGHPRVQRSWAERDGKYSSGFGTNVSLNRTAEWALSPSCPRGVVVRVGNVEWSTFEMEGIINGSTVTYDRPSAPIAIRRPSIQIETVRRTKRHKTVRISVRDPNTGAPIDLPATTQSGSSRGYCSAGPTDRFRGAGRLTVGGTQYQTGPNGSVVVTVSQPGFTDVRFVGAPWMEQQPAYTNTTAVVKFVPMFSAAWWIDLVTAVAIYVVVPIGFVYVVGRQGTKLISAKP